MTGRPQPTAGPDIRPAAPAPAAGDTDLAVQVMRLAPYLTSGTTLSCVFAAGAVSLSSNIIYTKTLGPDSLLMLPTVLIRSELEVIQFLIVVWYENLIIAVETTIVAVHCGKTPVPLSLSLRSFPQPDQLAEYIGLHILFVFIALLQQDEKHSSCQIMQIPYPYQLN